MDLCSINDSAAYIDRPIANFEHDKSQNTHISDMVALAAFISNSQTPMPSLNKCYFLPDNSNLLLLSPKKVKDNTLEKSNGSNVDSTYNNVKFDNLKYEISQSFLGDIKILFDKEYL